MTPTAASHLSSHRVVGDLSCTPLERVLEQCRRHQLTGAVRVHDDGRVGTIELRLGAIEVAWFAGARGEEALARLRSVRDGTYEVSQRLPDLSGELGDAAEFWGEATERSLIEVMRHCEANALSCTIAVDGGARRGEIEYRAGEIVDVRLDGVSDDEAILALLRMPEARFHVAAPPLSPGIDGWPAVRRAPTEPFHLGHLRDRPPPPLEHEDEALGGRGGAVAGPDAAAGDEPSPGALVLAARSLSRRPPPSRREPLPRRSWVARLRDRVRDRLRGRPAPAPSPPPALDAAGLDWVLGRVQAFLASRRRRRPPTPAPAPPRRVPVLGRIRSFLGRLLSR